MQDDSIALQKAELQKRRVQLSVEKQALLEKRQRGETENLSKSSPLLVRLQMGDSKRRPLFFIHPIGGSVWCYVSLVHYLDPHQTCYGLQAQGLDGERPPLSRVEEMAQRYIALVRSVQPEGPYLLAGWSMGGVVAFEMAQELQAQRQLVTLLALIDAYVPAGYAEPETDEIWFLANLVLSRGLPLDTGLSVDATRFEPLAPDERLTAMWEYLKQGKVVLPDMELSEVHRLFYIFQCNNQALQRYAPRVYSGPIVLFQASQQLLAKQRSAEASGWRALAGGGLTVHTLPGNHYSLLREPHIAILAKQLRIHLHAIEIG